MLNDDRDVLVKNGGDPEDGQGFPTVSLEAASPERVGT